MEFQRSSINRDSHFMEETIYSKFVINFLYSVSAAFVLSIAAFVPTDDQSNPGSQNSSA